MCNSLWYRHAATDQQHVMKRIYSNLRNNHRIWYKIINRELLRVVLGRLYSTLCQRMETITRNGLNNTIFMIPGNLTHFYTEYLLQISNGMNGIQCNVA